jgi:hypothetical protein
MYEVSYANGGTEGQDYRVVEGETDKLDYRKIITRMNR